MTKPDTEPTAIEPHAGQYILGVSNIHTLTSSLEIYPRDRTYTVLFDASLWYPLHILLKQEALRNLASKQLSAARLFYREFLRILEGYQNIVIVPEVKGELANLIASTLAQIDRQRLQYERMSPSGKDRVVRKFNLLLQIEELMRKLRARLEERSKASRPNGVELLENLQDTIGLISKTLSLKKPGEDSRTGTDEHLVARAFYEVLVHHRRVAVYTRDEDVRRIASTAYKLLVSKTLRNERVEVVRKALQLGNLVVLKYNHQRQVYTRFFESQTQQEIGDFIFSKFLAERAKVKLINTVRNALASIGEQLDLVQQPKAEAAGAAAAEPLLRLALEVLHDRMTWYQEVARAVGLSDVHEAIRVHQALHQVAVGIAHDPMAAAVEQTLTGLHKRRLHLFLAEINDKEKLLHTELKQLTEASTFQRDVSAAERLQEVAADIARNARARAFFTRALGTGDYYLDNDHFRKTEDLTERFRANGFDVRDGACLVPAADVAHLTGLTYDDVLRLASQHRIADESGLLRIDMATLIGHFI